jgi:hypothetical protein
MKRLTRRELVAVAVAPSVGMALAQTPPQTEDLAKAVSEANRLAAETLAKVAIPVATEPAFHFRA